MTTCCRLCCAATSTCNTVLFSPLSCKTAGFSAAKEELRGYLTDLYHGYTELFGSAGCAISRMKGHWFYLIHCFAGAEKLEKQLKKLREPWEYEVVVNQIFTLPLVEND